MPVDALLRKHGITERRSSSGAASLVDPVSDARRLRELETKNAKLKRMYADLALENAAIKDVLNLML